MIALVFALLQVGAAPCAALPQGHVAATEARAARDVEAAIAESREVRRRAPECADAHLAFAIALNQRLQASSGLAALTRSREYRAVLDRAITRAVVLYRIGEALEKSGECADAAAVFDDAARLDSSVDGLNEARARVRRCERPAASGQAGGRS